MTLNIKYMCFDESLLCSNYTTYYDQMILYAAIRKTDENNLNHRIYNERTLKGFVPGVIANLHQLRHFNPSYTWWNLPFGLQNDFDFTEGKSINDIYGKISARESALSYHKYSYKKGDWRWSKMLNIYGIYGTFGSKYKKGSD